MNFWEAQKQARARTALYILLFVVLAIAMSVFFEFGMRYLIEDYNPTDLPWMGVAFGLLTFTVSGAHYLSFVNGGGGYVAESLGAKRVDPATTNRLERQLLNVVEEMAVAASLPVPSVYILNVGQINAFAAGMSPDNSAITVTTGTLHLLNRDELQGVVAHEFGHVSNGDILINMRLAAMVMGFFLSSI